jgi:hypothetical protein
MISSCKSIQATKEVAIKKFTHFWSLYSTVCRVQTYGCSREKKESRHMMATVNLKATEQNCKVQETTTVLLDLFNYTILEQYE